MQVFDKYLAVRLNLLLFNMMVTLFVVDLLFAKQNPPRSVYLTVCPERKARLQS